MPCAVGADTLVADRARRPTAHGARSVEAVVVRRPANGVARRARRRVSAFRCSCATGAAAARADARRRARGAGPQRVVAPMPGKVVRVLVKPGDEVKPRQGLVVVEAMKMENELRAARDGTRARGVRRAKASRSTPARAGGRGVTARVETHLPPRPRCRRRHRRSSIATVLVSVVTIDLGPSLKSARRARRIEVARPADAHRPARRPDRAAASSSSRTCASTGSRPTRGRGSSPSASTSR